MNQLLMVGCMYLAWAMLSVVPNMTPFIRRLPIGDWGRHILALFAHIGGAYVLYVPLRWTVLLFLGGNALGLDLVAAGVILFMLPAVMRDGWERVTFNLKWFSTTIKNTFRRLNAKPGARY